MIWPLRFDLRNRSTRFLIIAIDEKSLAALDQEPGEQFDRNKHAELLGRLSQSRLVVFDLFFARPAIPAPMRDWPGPSNNRVMFSWQPIAALRIEDCSSPHEHRLPNSSPMLRAMELPGKTCRTGAGFHASTTLATAWEPSLSWAAAELATAAVNRAGITLANGTVRPRIGERGERWINYYGTNRFRAFPTAMR